MKYVSVKGLGKAIDRAIAVGIRLQQEGKKVGFVTSTVTVVDEFESTVDLNEDVVTKKRSVSCMEVRVYV